MADGRDPSPPGFSFRNSLPWTEIFRCFQVALDPRKLFVAAVGILLMAFGWYLLSVIFFKGPPSPESDEYSNRTILTEYGNKKKPDGSNYTEQDAKEEGDRRYNADRAQWKLLAELAGPGGQLRTMPWYENRGPNPYLFATRITNQPASEWGPAAREYVVSQVPVLTEPLVKLILPVVKFVAPGVSALTRFYLFLVILWTLLVWAFFGGVITRLAAVQLANKGPITLRQAARFVCTRYVSYVLAPVVLLAIVGVVIVGAAIYGLFGMIPFVGDILVLGLFFPLLLIAGGIMAVFLVGLVGYPLMYPTLSAEGDSSDTFDALSRSVNYVYQSPWHYVWYWIVTIVYGAVVTFFVLFFASLMVYLGKWAVSQAPFNESTDRKPDYLFIYAPESFGWRELLLKGSPYAQRREVIEQRDLKGFPNLQNSPPRREERDIPDPPGSWRQVIVYQPANQPLYDQNRAEFWWYNNWGAGLVCFWLTLFFLMMVGFSYSFFWTASTMIYLLMRRGVDEAEVDEVFIEEEEPEAPLPPPKLADGTGTPATPGTALPVITPPASTVPPAPPPPAVSPPVVPPPPPPATIPFSGTSTPEPGPAVPPADAPKKPDEEK